MPFRLPSPERTFATGVARFAADLPGQSLPFGRTVGSSWITSARCGAPEAFRWMSQ